MPQVFKLKNSTQAGKVPAADDLQTAELALNLVDQKLYSKDASGTVFEIGKVKISETAPDSASAGELWWADTDVDDGGGRLYVWTGDEWVDTSLPGGGGGGFTQDDANALYLSKTISDTAAGEITFKKGTTHEGGVSVTGGLAEDVKNGLYSDGDKVFIAVDSQKKAIFTKSTCQLFGQDGAVDHFTSHPQYTSIRAKNTTLNNPTLGLDVEVDKADLLEHSIVNAHVPIYTNVANDSFLSAFQINNPKNNTSATGVKFSGYKAINLTDKFDTNYGFYSQLDNSPKNNFNFYASGTAKNYFAGITHIASDVNNLPSFNGSGGVGVKLGSDGEFYSTFTQSSNAHANLYITRSGSNSGQLIRFYHTVSVGTAGTQAGRIELDGPNAVLYSSGSDYRLKENITSLSNAAERVKQLKTYQYNFIGDTTRVFDGFLAHELAEVAPRAVSGTKDEEEAIGTLADYNGTVLETEVTEPSAEDLTYTEETTDEYGVSTQTIRTRTWTATGTRPVYQGVDQTKLIPLLTKALQETIAKNEELEARLAALEGA